ncbi:ABC transporter permease [Desertibacillus haloalkaliphilus]|nr:ABC transporter permease [Desertibacillus haloalkaliphilus]MBU8906776.1 ABC transporter permease [Desertibacillus haloalkaliphilus]
MKPLQNYWLSIILVLVLITLWEISASIYDKTYILPTPSAILEKMIELNDVLLFVHLPATLQVIVIGLLISIVFGVSLAVWMNQSTLAEKTFFPIVIASQTIPIIALAPIFALWFGYSIWSKVVVTILITFFPITVSTFDGLRSTSKDVTELLKTMGATKKQIFLKVQVPSTLPYFFSGLKIAVTLSVIGAAIGEWLGANAGLGYFSRRMMTQFDGAGVFAPIVWLSILGIGLFLLVKALEKITLKWRKHS